MFVCKLRTPSCSHYEHFNVYPAYKRQTGNVVTRQTHERAPRLTRPPSAHISRGALAMNVYEIVVTQMMIHVPCSFKHPARKGWRLTATTRTVYGWSGPVVLLQWSLPYWSCSGPVVVLRLDPVLELVAACPFLCHHPLVLECNLPIYTCLIIPGHGGPW